MSEFFHNTLNVNRRIDYIAQGCQHKIININRDYFINANKIQIFNISLFVQYKKHYFRVIYFNNFCLLFECRNMHFICDCPINGIILHLNLYL